MQARGVRPSFVALAALLACGCYASHPRASDSGRLDAAERCTFSFRGRDGSGRTCVIEHEDASCTDAARCLCLDRLEAPTDAALAECVLGEQTPRALVTLSDFCDRELSLGVAITDYLRPEGPLHLDARCAEIPARFAR
jgi:hypothetical protein